MRDFDLPQVVVVVLLAEFGQFFGGRWIDLRLADSVARLHSGFSRGTARLDAGDRVEHEIRDAQFRDRNGTIRQFRRGIARRGQELDFQRQRFYRRAPAPA